MGVAQERFFYEIEPINKTDEKELRNMILSLCNEYARDSISDFLDAISEVSYRGDLLELIEKYASRDRIDLSEQAKQISKEIRRANVNFIEDYQMKIEGFGKSLMGCKNLPDLQKMMESNDSFFATMAFLSFQYFRTKKLKAVCKKFYPESHLLIKHWNTVAVCFALNLSKPLSMYPVSITLLNNQSTTDFLTSDQPAFNIFADELDETGNVNKFELYYPLSSRLAIAIKFSFLDGENISEAIVDNHLAKYYNEMIIKHAHDFIFATNEKALKEIRDLV